MAASPIGLVLLCSLGLSVRTSAVPTWFQNISTSLFSSPGDIMLGGLFPINQLSSNLSEWTMPGSVACESLNLNGLALSIVMKYAVDEINANQFLLPGVKLGYETYDTCKQSAIIVNPTLSFLTGKASRSLSVQCNYTDYETSMSAVIGPHSSEMVAVIGKLMGFFLMPQISFSATSDTFSDSVLYPSFFRTVPSDKNQISAMAQLLNTFSWNWVALVGSDEEYGQQAVQLFSKMTEQMSICVAYQGLIPIYTDPQPVITTIIDQILLNKVGVVVVFSIVQPTVAFFNEVIKRNVTGVWIASTSWSLSNQLTSIPNIQSVGTIIGFTDRTQRLPLLTPYSQALFSKISQESASNAPPPAPSGPGSPTDPCPQCRYLSTANMSLMNDPAVQRTAFSVYAAVRTAAQALHNMLGCNGSACMWSSETKIYPWKLLEVLRNTSVNVLGTQLVFDSSGNPNLGYNLIQWVWKSWGVDFTYAGGYYQQLSINVSLLRWHTADGQVPQSTCSAACATGQVRRVKGFHSCCFDCIDCLPGTYQKNPDDIQCTKCPGRQWSSLRSNNCTSPSFDVFSWRTPEAARLLALEALLLLCFGWVAAVLLRHRGTPMVQASGGALGLAGLLSLAAACLSLLLFLGQPGDTACRLQLPLISFFQTVTLSIMTSVSLQILYVTEFPEKAASHLQWVRGPGRWLVVLVLCAVQVGLCAWFVKEGPSLTEYVANMEIDFVRAFLSCPVLPLIGFALMQGFNSALALLSFMCTFMASKPLHQYNLARDITFSSLIYCVLWVLFIPIYIGLNDKNRATVYVSFTLIGDLGLVAAYYFPKCYFLLKQPELNTPQHFCTFLEGVPPVPAEEEPQPKAESEH
ncbi:taste receptor type 1 member 3 [Betta splendens]|uniref:Taste receptor type 1 member 3 n=1 Tax=Betta splendens TaxID=158456 RepID=A0A6P7MG59_BETSP|nr:taste receptor type 1 member 3 [Betta splendens]